MVRGESIRFEPPAAVPSRHPMPAGLAVVVAALISWGVSGGAASVFAAAEAVAAPDREAVREAVLATAPDFDGDLEDLASALWRHAELALHEEKSSALLADYLAASGFELRRGVAQLPTAFVAEWGSGRPILGIMAEFDALPEVGNAVEPRRTPRADGHPHGHGCGHNLFGAASVAAAVITKAVLEQHALGGTLRVYGTPAEETLVGKVYMARADLFADLDAAFDWHPSYETAVINEPTAAMNNFEVEFFGQASHAAHAPWRGRSALDAVELMNFAVNQLREHVEPTARIHYVIPDGGEAPNVVPDYARVWYYLRDIDRRRVEANYARILDIAAGAALATGTTHQVRLNTGVHDSWLNRPLQEVAQENLQVVGAPDFDPEFIDFNHQLQQALGLEATGLASGIEALAEIAQVTSGGSSDLSEVSRLAPMVTITVTAAGKGLPWHSWATAATSGHPGSLAAARVASRVLALNALDTFLDPALLARARKAFEERRGETVYRSPLPPEQGPPSAPGPAPR